MEQNLNFQIGIALKEHDVERTHDAGPYFAESPAEAMGFRSVILSTIDRTVRRVREAEPERAWTAHDVAVSLAPTSGEWTKHGAWELYATFKVLGLTYKAGN